MQLCRDQLYGWANLRNDSLPVLAEHKLCQPNASIRGGIGDNGEWVALHDELGVLPWWGRKEELK